jgi:hypothetical protein
LFGVVPPTLDFFSFFLKTDVQTSGFVSRPQMHPTPNLILTLFPTCPRGIGLSHAQTQRPPK